jgi:tetratricopeptide (TPR) repeat protein
MDTLRQWLQWLWQEHPEEIVGGLLFLILSALMAIFRQTLKRAWAAIRRKLSRPSPISIKEPTAPIEKASLPELFKRYIRGCDPNNPLNANYPYTPRDGRTKNELDDLFCQERRLLIVGKSGVGKTREALELLKRHRHHIDAILEIERLTVPYGYVPPSGDTVLFINDLPSFPEWSSPEAVQKTQATLKGICDYLERGTRSLFVLATARTDMGRLERTGYKPDGFWHFYDLPELSREDAVGNFVNAVAEKLGMTLGDDACQTLVRQHLGLRDGTYQGIVEYLEDKRYAEGVVYLDDVSDYLGQVHDWGRKYKKLVERDRAFHYAFEALAVLYQVRAEPYEFLVAELGGRLMPTRWRDVRTWTLWKRRRSMQRALEELVSWRHIGRLDGLLLCHHAKLDGKGDWRERVGVMADVLLGMARGRRAQLLSLSLFSLGATAQLSEFTAPAARLYARLLEINPDLAEAHSNYGTLLADLGHRDEAEEHYERALEINPDLAEVHYNYGNLLDDLGRRDEAEEHYKRALEINPDFALAHMNYGLLLKKLGRHDEAEAHYKRALEINPDFAEAHYNYGILLADFGRRDEAEEHYKRALEINPDDAEVHYNYGNLLDDFGRRDEAETHYKRALEINPDLAEAHSNYGGLLADLGRHDEAEVHYKRALEINPDLAEVHYNYGNLLKKLGRRDEAEAHYRRALKINPDFALAHMNYGLLLKKLGRHDEAEAHYKRALEINPDYAEAHSNYGLLLKKLGRGDEAEAHYRKALEINSDLAEAHLNYGVLLAELGRRDEAEAHHKRALEINPDYADAHSNYGLLLKKLGRSDEAEAHYKRALEINLDLAETHFNYGVLLEGLGQEEEMQEQIALACACALDSPTVTLEEALKRVVGFIKWLEGEGNKDKALELCNYLIEFWRRKGLEERAPEFMEVMREMRKKLE